ncbi:MAG TPA: phosphatidylserine decarboxylase [Thiolapillus brandeum]|uniref:Phosphatidylserine decarboxylase proenzyme n=1 Tax=Thiolapillus brandeum TaxID=1076588 RepID=A0A831NS35_9GAMM|nr:phosphatidylserine decarboxylase [Thiolapillus brandeum]
MQPGFKDKLFTAALKVLPQHLLAAAMYRITRSTWKPFKNMLIREVVARYAVNMFEAENPRPTSYPSFNAFFTRALKAEARPIAHQPDAIACPCDGKVSQVGQIEKGRLIQAKGHDFELLQLLGGDRKLSDTFSGGSYSTIYLSPKDYHRVHMPLSGRLMGMIFVPGDLFSVSEATLQLVPNLFARNERLICGFETAAGPMLVIMVGAIFVGSMETVWAGEIRGPRNGPSTWLYEKDQRIILAKGEEMGRFNMGSTVITLFAKNRIDWDKAFTHGVRVRMGQRIGGIRLESKNKLKPHSDPSHPAAT